MKNFVNENLKCRELKLIRTTRIKSSQFNLLCKHLVSQQFYDNKLSNMPHRPRRRNFLRRRQREKGCLSCCFCGKGPLQIGAGLRSSMVATVDHIVPLALGGPDSQDNFQISCQECNKRKGCRLVLARKLV